MTTSSFTPPTKTDDGEGVPEMVERVARAICRADGYDPDASVTTEWDIRAGGNGDPLWTMFAGLARAAIAAMREPTEAMESVTMYDECAWAGNNWRAMVDAALSASPATRGE